MEKQVFVHDFDVVVQLASFHANADDLSGADLKSRILKSIEQMDDSDIWSVCSLVHTIQPDDHGTTAQDWGI